MKGPAIAPAEIARDVGAAFARHPVDLLLAGGRIINVCSGEIHPGDVAISRGRIVAIREDFNGPAARRLSVAGKYIAPALVDSAFRHDAKPRAAGRCRGTGTLAHARTKTALRPRATASVFLDVRRAIRNGRTVFIDERIGPVAMGVLLGEVRRQGLGISPICFALDPERPADGEAHPVRVAMNSGFSAPQAFQMAALNPAVHYGMDDRVGSVAPGRAANLLILDNLMALPPERLLLAGEEIPLA